MPAIRSSQRSRIPALGTPNAASLRSAQRVRRLRPNGYLYVAVLFTTLIVMASVTAAVTISTTNLRSDNDRSVRDKCLRVAESEIQRLAAAMRASSQWRDVSVCDSYSNWRDFAITDSGRSSPTQVRHCYSDLDGDLVIDPWDSVDLSVQASCEGSQASVLVMLESDPKPLGLLQYSLTVADDLHLESGAVVSCERSAQVEGNCLTSSLGTIVAPRLECSGDVRVRVRGDLAASSVQWPRHDVTARYASLGTEIAIADLPIVNTERRIENCVISPAVNPFGKVDPLGIYWIDAGGGVVVIQDCRLDATLAIKNASRVDVRGAIVWTFPNEADVILATDSPIRLIGLDASLDENSLAVNFNPSTVPYRKSLFNSTATDVYPCELRGVIYSESDIVCYGLKDGGILRLTGSIIADRLLVHAPLAILQLDELLTSLPPGLCDPTPMRFVRGSFRRIPAP